jgi:hypothetical protein
MEKETSLQEGPLLDKNLERQGKSPTLFVIKDSEAVFQDDPGLRRHMAYEGRTLFLKSRGVRLVYFLNARSKVLISLNPAEKATSEIV